MLDCIIRGGQVIDGTGAPRRRADVGIRDGRIVAVGEIDEPAERHIDAEGRIVAPGFVDLHTHYDAQVFWDGALTPSPLHGVTTVIGGNCGFSVAPLTAEAGDYLMRMLSRVEGMPLESLQLGVPWDWTSFGEYLGRLDGTLAVNAGFLVGHSALRRVVMGDDAVGQQATPEQLAAMVELLETSLAEGGLGFSSSNAPTHNDGDARPVPSRHASHEEFVALAGALREHPGTALEFIPAVGIFDDDVKELMTRMSVAANRPMNWNMLIVNGADPSTHEAQLSAADYAAERGGRVVALTVPQPISVRINLRSGFLLDALPGWDEVIALPLPERKKAFEDPARRAKLGAGADDETAGLFRFFANWPIYKVDEAFTPETKKFEGRTIGEIAQELGKSPFDTFCDIAVADDLRTSFMPPTAVDDDATWAARAKVWDDPRAMIGASDAGAHLDMIDSFMLSTSLLGTCVRKKKLLTLESAVQKISDDPARLYGIKDRGRIEEGFHADLVVFDEDTVGPGPVHTRDDLPGGAARLFAEADGIEHVLVNGVPVVRGKQMLDARPGTVMRSGRDTETVEASS